ncbi:MAG: Uma2 family endonuclease [Tepidisphaeraceae bacterium]
MEVLVTDPNLADRLIAQRQEWEVDRFDEVWDGVYVLAPIADNTHQELQMLLGSILYEMMGMGSRPGVHVYMGVNVSDRIDGWELNYRWPDVAVFLPGTTAHECGSHWCGGPDFAVEIRCRGDRTMQKLPFYASVNVRELLIIDREPWSVEVYRLREGALNRVDRIAIDDAKSVSSDLLALSFRLIPASPRPTIEVAHRETGQRWSV